MNVQKVEPKWNLSRGNISKNVFVRHENCVNHKNPGMFDENFCWACDNEIPLELRIIRNLLNEGSE